MDSQVTRTNPAIEVLKVIDQLRQLRQSVDGLGTNQRLKDSALAKFDELDRQMTGLFYDKSASLDFSAYKVFCREKAQPLSN